MADVELTGAQVKELQAIEQAVHDLQALVDRARLAGINVDELEQRLRDANARRTGLLVHFSPATSSRRQR